MRGNEDIWWNMSTSDLPPVTWSMKVDAILAILRGESVAWRLAVRNGDHLIARSREGAYIAGCNFGYVVDEDAEHAG